MSEEVLGGRGRQCQANNRNAVCARGWVGGNVAPWLIGDHPRWNQSDTRRRGGWCRPRLARDDRGGAFASPTRCVLYRFLGSLPCSPLFVTASDVRESQRFFRDFLEGAQRSLRLGCFAQALSPLRYQHTSIYRSLPLSIPSSPPREHTRSHISSSPRRILTPFLGASCVVVFRATLGGAGELHTSFVLSLQRCLCRK